MKRLLLLALLVLLPSPPVAAQSAADVQLEGSWALRLDGAIIFRFDLVRDGEGWRGVWVRPGSFASDGNRFGNLAGPSETIQSSEGRAMGVWAEVTFPDERDGAVPDVFRFNAIGPNRAEMIYAGTGLAPYTLERVTAGALLGPWETGKVYRRPGTAASPSGAPSSRPAPAASPSQMPVHGPALKGR